MMVDSPLILSANYTFIRASEEVIMELVSLVFPFVSRTQRLFAHDLLRKPTPRFAQLITNAIRKHMGHGGLHITRAHNIVPSVLRNSFATLISGTTVTPTFKANYMALGSGTNAAANTDTQLQTETLRDTFSNRYSVTNVAYLDKFFSTAQVANNSYNEAGVFVDGTASANSGYLLSRVAISETMGANETLTVNASFTIS